MNYEAKYHKYKTKYLRVKMMAQRGGDTSTQWETLFNTLVNRFGSESMQATWNNDPNPSFASNNEGIVILKDPTADELCVLAPGDRVEGIKQYIRDLGYTIGDFNGIHDITVKPLGESDERMEEEVVLKYPPVTDWATHMNNVQNALARVNAT
jgi:hypothetical protein